MSPKEANYNITKGPQPQNNNTTLATQNAKNKTFTSPPSHPRKLNEKEKPTRK